MVPTRRSRRPPVAPIVAANRVDAIAEVKPGRPGKPPAVRLLYDETREESATARDRVEQALAAPAGGANCKPAFARRHGRHRAARARERLHALEDPAARRRGDGDAGRVSPGHRHHGRRARARHARDDAVGADRPRVAHGGQGARRRDAGRRSPASSTWRRCRSRCSRGRTSWPRARQARDPLGPRGGRASRSSRRPRSCSPPSWWRSARSRAASRRRRRC